MKGDTNYTISNFIYLVILQKKISPSYTVSTFWGAGYILESINLA